MGQKLSEILANAGILLDTKTEGKTTTNLSQREIIHEPGIRAKRLRDIYYKTLSSADNEFPYWYSRKYFELDGEIPVVRRAAALKRPLRILHHLFILVSY